MIKASPKPQDEIFEAVREYRSILNLGCGGCVSVCLAGGQKEVQALNQEINHRFKLENLSNRMDNIYNRLKAQDRLHHIYKVRPPMLWQNQIQRTTVQPAYAHRYKK